MIVDQYIFAKISALALSANIESLDIVSTWHVKKLSNLFSKAPLAKLIFPCETKRLREQKIFAEWRSLCASQTNFFSLQQFTQCILQCNAMHVAMQPTGKMCKNVGRVVEEGWKWIVPCFKFIHQREESICVCQVTPLLLTLNLIRVILEWVTLEKRKFIE